MFIAHGVGSRGDLPLPLWMFTWAATLALVVSFVALGVLWTSPRLAGAAGGARVSGVRLPSLAVAAQWVGRVAALALLATALWAGFFGSDDVAANLLPVTVYVVFWVGMQVISGLFGDLWRAISPLNTMAEWLARAVPPTHTAPPAVGHWPAAAGLAGFLFLELVHPSGSSPRVLAWAIVIHLVVFLALSLRWGPDWVADSAPFAALFSMLAAMAPIHVRNRQLTIRPPMSGLATMPVRAGTLATLLIVLGGTTFDGFVESELGRDVFGRPEGWSGAVSLAFGLLVSIVLIAALFGAGVYSTSRVTGLSLPTTASAFTPTLVPIVFGYAIAHYAQLLIDETQSFVFLLSDPGDKGWDLFGGADGQIDFNLISVDLIAWIQVLAILFGHIGAVLVAHDRALELTDHRTSFRSQYVMLFVMVIYSTLGLALLFNA